MCEAPALQLLEESGLEDLVSAADCASHQEMKPSSQELLTRQKPSWGLEGTFAVQALLEFAKAFTELPLQV